MSTEPRNDKEINGWLLVACFCLLAFAFTLVWIASNNGGLQ